MSEEIETGVSFTAKIMAARRAIKTQRPDALFTDLLAARLAGQEAIEAAIPDLEEYEKQGRPFTLVRTRFFDDFLNKYSDSIRQIVLLGSGMDTRAFRVSKFILAYNLVAIKHENISVTQFLLRIQICG